VTVKPAKTRGMDRKAMAALMAADRRVSFGPSFFLQNLRGLVRDRCPEPTGSIPSVQVHLLDGEVLDLCHIIGVSPNWIAMAVHEREDAERPTEMRTELVPYPLIARVSIQTTRHAGAHPIGFNTGLEPQLYGGGVSRPSMSPEEALNAVAGLPPRALPAAGEAEAEEARSVRLDGKSKKPSSKGERS